MHTVIDRWLLQNRSYSLRLAKETRRCKTWKSSRIKSNLKLIVYINLTTQLVSFFFIHIAVVCPVESNLNHTFEFRTGTHVIHIIIICNIGSTVCIIFVNDFIYYYNFCIFFSDVGGVCFPPSRAFHNAVTLLVVPSSFPTS